MSDQADSLTGTVAGPYLANQLSQKLGYAVAAAVWPVVAPYSTIACASRRVATALRIHAERKTFRDIRVVTSTKAAFQSISRPSEESIQ